MSYFPDWRIDFEAMKQERKTDGPNETVFWDNLRPRVDINLRENQVPQEPIFDEKPPVTVFSNRVFDEYHSPTL